MTKDGRQVNLEELDRLVRLALQRAGMSEENVEPVAKVMVAYEREAVKNHGILPHSPGNPLISLC